jgi:hypothetical protein
MNPEKAKFPLKRLVEVEWEDITTQNQGWMTREEVEKEYKIAICRSVGYVFKQTDDYIVLVQKQSPTFDDTFGIVHTIPMGCVKRVKRLWGLE